jgi:EmrB/QacA subfamily drug resistance transporter
MGQRGTKEVMAMTGVVRDRQEGTDRRRWAALVFIALAQLMVALDATIVSIALPSAQRALHFSTADRQWVITAYTMALAGLLLLGGRIADRFGRMRVFVVGLGGFALASAAGGAAPDFAALVAARAAQGAIAALLMPTALSLLAVTFTDPRERATAFTVYGSIAGSGAAIGLLLGGALTQYLAWRWCLYVNVPVAAVAAFGAWRLIPAITPPAAGGRSPGSHPRFDAWGVVLIGGFLVALVEACTRAVSTGWSDPAVLALLPGSGVLLAAFVVREARAAAPLLPLQMVLDRTRGGSSVAVLLATAGIFAAFLFLTYYLQVVLRYSPLEAGLAFLPVPVGSQLGSWLIARRLMPRVAPRLLMASGLLVAAAGMGLLTQLGPASDYLTLVLPAELLLGFGTSSAMVPAFSSATLGVEPRLAGVAAATVNAAGQVGASVGIALLNTVAAIATSAYLVTHAAGRATGLDALVHGYATATLWGTGILVLGALVTALLVNAKAPARREAEGRPRPEALHQSREVA